MLNLKFDNSDGEIHVMAFDGCRIRLDSNDSNLSDVQRVTSTAMG